MKTRLFPRLFLLLLVCCASLSKAQDTEKERKWAINGYVKDLVTVNVLNDSTLVDNLIHNRLNFKWFPSDQFTAYFEVRNRIFFGDMLGIPNFDQLVDVNNDYLDLSANWVDNESILFNSAIERAYVEWTNNDWEIRFGRQRINWGTNLIWNPNDIFNTYSFFDFDYEERPGSDAIRITKYTGFASSLEFAANINDDFDELVMAGLWKINKWDYDFQVFAGKAREDLALGIGWAGNIKNAGFKGEISYFNPYDNPENPAVWIASLSADYSFESSFYLHGSILFNSDGDIQLPQGGFNSFNGERLTVRTLSPYRYSTFLQTSYSFHPLISGGVAFIYYPGSNALFINPSATFSLKSNLDLDVLSQLFYDEIAGDYQTVARLIFLRLKWSF
ncbi:MAG: hypothetical protein AAFX87_15200 [Bacteroidota bacterium]